MRSLAYTISYILHPALIPVLTLLLVVQSDPILQQLLPSHALWRILLAVGITTGILPALSVLILSRTELIESVELKKRKERIVPFIMTLFYLLATYILLMNASLPSLLYSTLLGGIVAFTGLTLMTFFGRVSAHLCAYGSLVGALTGLFAHSPFPFTDLLILLVLVGGALASARFYLGAHSLQELAIGSIWGFAATFFFVSQDIHYVNHALF